MDVNPLLLNLLAGARKQQYGGKALLPYFRSSIAYQRGRGFGSVIRRLFRPVSRLFKKPIVRKGLSSLARAGATALVDAGKSSLDNSDVKFREALTKESQKQAEKILAQMRQSLGNRNTVAKQSGGSARRGGRKRKSVSRKPTAVKRRRVVKRHEDIFT